MTLILTETKDAIGTIVMNHLQKRNALSEALIGEITVALEYFREKNIRATVLRAPAGTKVWSAGHDVSELPDRGRDPLGWSDPLRILVRAIQEFPAPVIALIEGGVWGGGCEVAMACDILVATPESTFAITPAKLGVPYNLGGILTLMNMIPLPVAKEMLFTAQPIPTSQALNLGVINYIKSTEEIERFVLPHFQKSGRNNNSSGNTSKRPTSMDSDSSQVAVSFSGLKPTAVSPNRTPILFRQPATDPNAVTRSTPVAVSASEKKQ
jgi:methylmalonyl-CoA decarboxylase